MKKEVSNKIKFFNFIFTLLIVIYHFRFKTGFNIQINNNVDETLLTNYLAIINNLAFLSMTVFFMISAFLFYNNITTTKEAVNKIKKRVKTLIIPYFSWSLIVLIFKILTEHKVPFDSLYTFIKCIFFDPIDGPLWYILALCIFMLLSPLIVKLKNKKKLSFIVLIFVLMIVELKAFGYIKPVIRIDTWWWYSNLLSYIPAYAIGTFLGLNYSQKIVEERYNEKKFQMIGIVIVVACFIILNYVKVYANSQYYIYILLTIGIWISLPSKIFKRKVPGFMSCSFFIYAMHQPILIPIINKVIEILIKDFKINVYQFITIKTIGLVFIFLISYITYIFVKEILPTKIFFMLTGGRN